MKKLIVPCLMEKMLFIRYLVFVQKTGAINKPIKCLVKFVFYQYFIDSPKHGLPCKFI